MAVERGSRRAGHGGPRQAGRFPVLRWLKVGAATAGVGVALAAAPAAALADTGTASSGAESSQGAASSAGVGASPDASRSGESSGKSHQDGPDADGEDAPESPPDDADTVAADADPEPGEDSSEQLADQSSASTNPPDDTTIDDEPPATAGGEANDEATPRSGREGRPASAATGTTGSSRAVGAAPTTADVASGHVGSPPAPAKPILSDIPAEPRSMNRQAMSVNATTTPAASAQSTVSSPAAPAAPEESTSRPQYPDSVSAPVSWRAIVTEGLSWIGLGALAPHLPVPQFPVPDLIAGAWIGLRRLHYTFVNSAPRLTPGAYTEDPHTGVSTGNLGGHDADGDAISYVVTSAPAHGTVHIADDGTYTYTPGAEFARTGGTDTFTVVAEDTGAANPWHLHPISDLVAGLTTFLNRLGLSTPPNASTATVTLIQSPVVCNADAGGNGCSAGGATVSPSVMVHNSSDHTIWVYNLTNSGDYSIAADFVPLRIDIGASAPVSLAVGTGAVGTPENRIYIVEGDAGFTLPVASPGGVDAFNPTAASAGNSFLNYNFLEYFLYPADGGYEYTIDTSYIDEWSLPIQYKFALNGADWSGAVDGKTYGFKDFDTVVSQLTAAGGPYKDLVWNGQSPWGPQPPATVSRIIGPDKVWAQQENQLASNVNMSEAGWVPASYQEFVQYGSYVVNAETVYPYAQNGTQYSSEGNFTFWKIAVDAPSSTPYPTALRTAAILDGFPAEQGVYGFFTYPNDETAGQFTNIPNSVSLDIYVHGSSDGSSDSVIEGGQWIYSGSSLRPGTELRKHHRDLMIGSSATDTFILDSVFTTRRAAPLVGAEGEQRDIVVIDRAALAGATSFEVDTVHCAWFLGSGFANYNSQFVYERSTGYLYYDEDPRRFGYTGVLAKLPRDSIDLAEAVFVL